MEESLLEEEVRRWEEEGWCRLGQLPEDLLEDLEADWERLLARTTASAGYRSPEHCLRFTHLWTGLWKQNPAFASLLRLPSLLDSARFLLGSPQLRLYSQQLVVKHPASALPLPWHQDAPLWPSEGPGLSLWLALDDVFEEAGCLCYGPGKGAEPLPEWKLQLAPTRRGQLLAHNGLTWHRSGPNRGSKVRRGCVIGLGVAGAAPRKGEWDEERCPLLPLSAPPENGRGSKSSL